MIISDNNKQLSEAVKIYKALGEPTRLKIVLLLAKHKEFTCTEIIEELKVPACSTLSHHLKLLTDCGLLEIRKEGTFHICRLKLDILRKYAPGIIE